MMLVRRVIDKAIRSYDVLVNNIFFSNFYCPHYGEMVEIKLKGESICFCSSPGREWKEIDLNREYEGPFLTRLVDDVKASDPSSVIYFDIGAGFGLDALVLNKLVNCDCKIYAFEPDPFSRIYFNYNTQNLRNATLIPQKVSNEDQATSLTIDKFCIETGTVPTHIKLDIEGGEVYALNGMIDTLEHCKPKLFIEFHEIFIRERLNLPYTIVEKFFGTLIDLGYRLEFNAHHYPLFSNSSVCYDYQWFDSKPNSDLYAVVAY